jgi:hypothetical protein
MKRYVLAAAAGLAVVAGFGAAAAPAEFGRLTETAAERVVRARAGIEANPVPAAVALGTFVLTLALRKGRAKAAGLVLTPPGDGAEPAVVRRAKARATRAQLIADQIGLENRRKKMAGEVAQAEKDACYTEQAVVDAERVLAEKRKAHAAAADRLDALADEQDRVRAELAAIDAELKKLAELV